MTFEAWVEANLDWLFRFATVLIGDRALAEDVVMDTLGKVHDHWERLASLEDLGAYVRRMVVNQHVSWRRKWSRQYSVPEPPDLPGSDDFASEYAERQALVAALGQLPPKQRAAVVLRFYEGLSSAEVAEVLGCRPVTARGYISRALRSLRIELSQHESSSVSGGY